MKCLANHQATGRIVERQLVRSCKSACRGRHVQCLRQALPQTRIIGIDRQRIAEIFRSRRMHQIEWLAIVGGVLLQNPRSYFAAPIAERNPIQLVLDRRGALVGSRNLRRCRCVGRFSRLVAIHRGIRAGRSGRARIGLLRCVFSAGVLGWRWCYRVLRAEKLHAQQNCGKHNGKHQQGTGVLLPALLVRIFIFGQETSCCFDFRNAYSVQSSANASTTMPTRSECWIFCHLDRSAPIRGSTCQDSSRRLRVYLSYPVFSSACRAARLAWQNHRSNPGNEKR